MDVFEEKNILPFLQKRNLLSRYSKCKNFLREDLLKVVDFKIRKPKSQGIYSFRINKKFRAFGIFRDGNFYVFEISDHQK